MTRIVIVLFIMNTCYISAFMSLSVLPNIIPMGLHPKGLTAELPWLGQILKGEREEQLAVVAFFFLTISSWKRSLKKKTKTQTF